MVEVDEDVGRPELPTKLSAWVTISPGDSIRADRKLKRLALRQPDSGSVPGQLSGLEIEFEEAKANHLLIGKTATCTPISEMSEFKVPTEANPLTLSTLTQAYCRSLLTDCNDRDCPGRTNRLAGIALNCAEVETRPTAGQPFDGVRKGKTGSN